MFKKQARFVTRMIAPGDGLFIGAAFEGQDAFEPNTIYEIVRCPISEDLIVKKIGKSIISEGRVDDSIIKATWSTSYEYTMSVAGKGAFLTEFEYKSWLEESDKNG